MPLREFTDTRGTHWTVWSTIPDWRSAVPKELQDGWLTFESGGARRRLAPIPREWEEAPGARLQLYCDAAEKLEPARRSTPIRADSR